MKNLIKLIKDFPPTSEYKYDENLWNRQHGDAFVILNCRATDIYYPEHWTPFSLKFAFSGKEFYKLRNTTYAVTDAHFLVLNKGCEYASYILSNTITESLTLNFTAYNLSLFQKMYKRNTLELLDNPFHPDNEGIPFFEKLYPYTAAMLSCITQLKSLISHYHLDCLAITETLYEILEQVFLLNSCSIKEADNVKAKKRTTRLELYKRLTTVKDFIASCYNQDLTLEQMAATCYLNPFHLLREFKKLYHTTPHQYLTQIRLQHAEHLILRSSAPVKTIVEEIGFQDTTSFNRLFKRHYGVTPYAHRNTALNEAMLETNLFSGDV